MSRSSPTPSAPPPRPPPLTPEQAIRRSNIALANLLLDEPTDEELRHLGNRYRAGGDFARALVLHLTALRGHPDDPQVEYELACDFAFAHETKLGIKYLQRAADHGYWGYRIVADDTDVNPLKSDPAFAPTLAKIKASFDTQAPRHAPGMTVKLPTGAAPPGGWPVVFFLHGFASSRHDFDPEAQIVSTLGYVGVTLDGTQVMGPAAYTWDRKSTEPTHHQLQAALKSFKFPIDPKRIYLQGFSQGGMHAVRRPPRRLRRLPCQLPRLGVAHPHAPRRPRPYRRARPVTRQPRRPHDRQERRDAGKSLEIRQPSGPRDPLRRRAPISPRPRKRPAHRARTTWRREVILLPATSAIQIAEKRALGDGVDSAGKWKSY